MKARNQEKLYVYIKDYNTQHDRERSRRGPKEPAKLCTSQVFLEHPEGKVKLFQDHSRPLVMPQLTC
jgi:hypothetical protein